MTTLTQKLQANGVGAVKSVDTLTVIDNRTGKRYEVPIEDGTIRATELRQIKTHEDDFGLMTYDPAFMDTASCRSAITFIDGEQGHPRVPRLPDRAAGGEVDLPRGRLPAGPRRAADHGAAGRLDARDHAPHVRAREHQGVHAGLPLRRAPDGDAARRRSARSRRSTPRRSAIKDEQIRQHADHPADREDADARRVLLPPQPRACRTCTRTTTCPTPATSSR